MTDGDNAADDEDAHSSKRKYAGGAVFEIDVCVQNGLILDER